MRYSLRRHSRPLALKYQRWFGFRGVDHADIKSNASSDDSSDIGPHASTTIRTAQCGAKHGECANFLIKKPIKERREIRRRVVARRTENFQRLFSNLMAQPKERRQVGNVVGMKMTYADHPQIFKFRS